jgi:tetrahydromethanopterin S-methyltransferase subunit E
MVTCQRCGAKNAEDSDFCTKCGAKLGLAEPKMAAKGEEIGRKAEEWGRRMGERAEEECFGLPGGGAICGAVFGLLIIIVGLSIVFTWPFWFLIGPLVVIVIGVIIVVASIYAYRKSTKSV